MSDLSNPMLGGRFELLGGPVSIQGLDGCTDQSCTRLINRETGEDIGCAGYHCAVCLMPSGMTGHAECREESAHV